MKRNEDLLGRDDQNDLQTPLLANPTDATVPIVQGSPLDGPIRTSNGIEGTAIVPDLNRLAIHRRAQSEIPRIHAGDSECTRTGWHRSTGSLRDVLETMSQGLDSLRQGIEGEVHHLQDAWKQELRDAAQTYFLDMSMTRSLSVVPDEIETFFHETVGSPSVEILPTSEESESFRPSPGLGPYFGLLAAIVAVSSNSSALALLEGVSPPLKYFWRTTAVSILLAPLAARHIWKYGLSRLVQVRLYTLGAAVICFVGAALAFVTALQYTSVGIAVNFANSQALLMILGKLVTGQHVHWMEASGVVVAFVGGMLCSLDTSHESEAERSHGWYGESLAMISGIFGVGYLTTAKAIRSDLPVTVFMFLVMSGGALLIFIFMTVTRCEYHFSNDPYTGLYGWLTMSENRFIIMLYIALVCNLIGTMGFVRAMKHLDNLVIAVATLLEPAVATILAYWIVGANLPGPFGWLGNLLIIAGTFAVVYRPSHQQTSPE